MSNNKKATILLIEDEDGLILTLTDCLENQGYEIVARKDGIQGEKEALSGKAYDLILLDVMLPGKDGFQVCKSIRDSHNNIPILMLTARDTPFDTVLGLRLGADDYLTKPFNTEVLLARIDALLRRSQYECSDKEKVDIFFFGNYALNTIKQNLTHEGVNIPLNAQEYRLLYYLVRNPGRVISRQELLDEVWGYDDVLTTRTIDVHIAWLRHKLGEKDVPHHIRTIRGAGYKFVVEE